MRSFTPDLSRTLAVPIVIALAATLGAQEEERPTRQDPAVRQDLTLEQRLSDIPIPSDQEGREVLELSLLDALRFGRRNNLTLRAEELRPFELEEVLRIERAFFQPEMFGRIGTASTSDPALNTFQPQIKRDVISGSLGLRQRVVTGGLFDLTFSPSRLRQSATGTIANFPPEQWSTDLTATLTQPLLRGAWTDYTLSGVHTAEAELHAERARFQREVQNTLLQIVEAYWELVFAREDYRVVIRALELAREQLRITNERIRVRELAERDRISDEAAVALQEENRIRADNAIRDREDDLRHLLFDDHDGKLWSRNLRPISPIESSFEPPNEGWRELTRKAILVRPDIIELQARVRSAEIEYNNAERDVLPLLDLVGSYGGSGVSETAMADAWDDTIALDFPAWSVALEFVVPIGNDAARGNRDRAALALERIKRDLYAAEVGVAREVRNALRDLTTLAESIRAARESVRLAANVLDTEREKERVGRSTQFEVQQRNQELLQASQRLLRSQLTYRIREANLLHARGVLRAPTVQ